ncbi:MAG: hypothetical protein II662_01190 [Bacteroidales bacterium]|nr:hypothetical protein [Bacteroidales bacterium]
MHLRNSSTTASEPLIFRLSCYSIFLNDLTGMMERTISEHRFPKRVEELFLGFMHLLPRHFAEQLHFAETTTFARFFQRMKGMNPKEFRKRG